jgi:hypothetical protein
MGVDFTLLSDAIGWVEDKAEPKVFQPDGECPYHQ